VLESIMSSAEFVKLQQREAVVFMHIQKTGGTSLQRMLRDVWGQNLFAEHGDTLATHKGVELSAYSIFAGHFNYDSLRHLPRKRQSIFTFVREPKERLLSLYYFLRAHEPTAPNWEEGMIAANKYLVDEFFARNEIGDFSTLWNHMTFCVMGRHEWAKWRTAIKDLDAERVSEFVSQTARPAIRQRLSEFAFVGLQRDFVNSVNMLCRILNWPPFEKIRDEHGLEQLTRKNPHFKRDVPKQAYTQKLDKLLDRYVQLDAVLYEEAERLYVRRVSDYADRV
jgi:Sulfotransferase family